MVKEAKTKRTRPWRKVVAEVTPEAVQAYWRNPDGSMQKIKPSAIRADLIHRVWAENHLPYLKKQYPGIAFAGLEHTPRGGVGLYVFDARVFFRHVVLEPLALDLHGDP